METDCQSCGAAMQQVHQQDHFHCSSCNLFKFPTELQDSPDGVQPTGKTTAFQCPKCLNQKLEVGLILKSQVCFCNNCRGFVIDIGTLGFLLNSMRLEYEGPDDKPIPLDQAALQETLQCPACVEPMESYAYYGPGNVVLNGCHSCNLAWLDHGEMSAIIRAPGRRVS